MKIVPFQSFPRPYPDECLYSILSRCFARNPTPRMGTFLEELFGIPVVHLASFIILPRGIGRMEQWFETNAAWWRYELAMFHSCYPYFSMSLGTEKLAEIQHAIDTGDRAAQADRSLCASVCNESPPDHLRYCPECAAEDRRTYGEPYWHRLHQLTGCRVCPKHGAPIVDSSLTLKAAKRNLVPASYILQRENPHWEPSGSYFEKFRAVAEDMTWSLENGVLLGGLQSIAGKYKRAFTEKDLAAVSGVLNARRIGQLKKEFTEYHGGDFLDAILVESDRSLDWLVHAAHSGRTKRVRPLQHILLMEFLYGSASTFHAANPQGLSYGDGLWPCVNKVCSHYGEPVAHMTESFFREPQLFARFECPYCGLVYQRSDPDAEFARYSHCPQIIDFGPVWDRKLRQLLETDGIRLKDVMEQMHVGRDALLKYARGADLDLPWERRRHGKNYDQFYKEAVLGILADEPLLTAAELQRRLPGSVVWLKQNDPAWLNEHVVRWKDHPEFSQALTKKRIENRMQALQKAHAQILEQYGSSPRRRISKTKLCKVAGIAVVTFNRYAEISPEFAAFACTIEESREDWLKRRVMRLAEQRAAKGKPKLEFKHVCQDLGFHKHTLESDRPLLEEFIVTANRLFSLE